MGKPRGERDRTAYGLRLYLARKAAGLTQQQLAKAAGIAQSTLSELETTANGSALTPQLARACGVSADYLASGEETGEAVTAAPPPALDPEIVSLLRDLDDLAPAKRSAIIDHIHQLAEEAREAAAHLNKKRETTQAAARRSSGKNVATVTWGDGNRRQRSLPLVTTKDPFTAAPSEAEERLYRAIQGAPKAKG